eukprot:1110013-Heterocapsa_arctica.AAC.1
MPRRSRPGATSVSTHRPPLAAPIGSCAPRASPAGGRARSFSPALFFRPFASSSSRSRAPRSSR